MTTILPSSFRIAYDVSESLKQTLEAELEGLIPEEILQPREGETEGRKAVLKKLPFLPHAYQLSVDKSSIKKDPATEKLHLWLKQQTLAGFITRQETVSMVPPVILAPEADDVVFDMCAVSTIFCANISYAAAA
jgi:16S rRNA C967 or C1407 C5-methylase (RsmB/RsmF family)